VAQPVSEGQQFAIVWRRGSLPPWQLSKEESSEIASARIVERRTREALDAIVEKKSPHISGGLLKKLKRPSCRIFEQ
jgi:hypothetical protein